MIRRYRYGEPWTTGAIAQPVGLSSEPLPYLTPFICEGKQAWRVALAPEDMIFGLGEQIRGIDKRGHLYRSWATDDPNQTETRNSLYGAHNFLLFVREGSAFGVYFDDPGLITFDLGYTRMDEAVITS